MKQKVKSFNMTFAGVRHNLAEDSYAMSNLIFIKNQDRPKVIKLFSYSSTEHEIYKTHKC